MQVKQDHFKDNIEKVLNKLSAWNNRNARFRAVISLIVGGNETQFEGICNGKIIDTHREQKDSDMTLFLFLMAATEVLLKCRSKKRTVLTIEQKLRLNWSHFCKT
jgi:XTP/dITP diphosphohydrolase